MNGHTGECAPNPFLVKANFNETCIILYWFEPSWALKARSTFNIGKKKFGCKCPPSWGLLGSPWPSSWHVSLKDSLQCIPLN